MAFFSDRMSFLENKNVFAPIKETKVDFTSKLRSAFGINTRKKLLYLKLVF